MPNKDTIYPIEELNKLAFEDQLIYPANSENKFFSLDLEENSEIYHSEKNKRKFVCVELINNKLQVKNYSNKDLAKALESNKNGGAVIPLVFYVKNSEKEKLTTEIRAKLKKLAGLSNQEKINKIRDHFKKNVWKNFTSFDSYHDISEAYDQHTGEPITKATNELAGIYDDVKKRYEELKIQYAERSEKYQEILTELKTVLDNMETEYKNNRENFQHLSTDTVASVIKCFEKLKEQFEEKTQQLEIEKSNDERNAKLRVLEKNVIKLQKDCEDAIPPGAACTEEIFEERKRIKSNIDLLMISIQNLKNHDIPDSTIKGLEKKLNSLHEEIITLNCKIVTPQIINFPNEQTNKVWENIQPILENIQNHAAKTSEAKAGILNKILDYLKNIKDKIVSNSPLDEITDIIKNIKIFIKTNYNELAAARGFFSNQGKSVSLIQALESQLDKLVSTTNGQEQSVASVRP